MVTILGFRLPWCDTAARPPQLGRFRALSLAIALQGAEDELRVRRPFGALTFDTSAVKFDT